MTPRRPDRLHGPLIGAVMLFVLALGLWLNRPARGADIDEPEPPLRAYYRALLPPPEWDRPFRGQVVETRRPYYAAKIICARKGARGVDGCSWVERGVCHIVYSIDHPDHVQESIVRHERAHCNGWPAHHPGGW